MSEFATSEREPMTVLEQHALLIDSTDQGKDSPPSPTDFQLLDNSTHGTFVNGVKMSKDTARTLRIGDVIEFGASSRLYIYCNNVACSINAGSLTVGIKKSKCETLSATD